MVGVEVGGALGGPCGGTNGDATGLEQYRFPTASVATVPMEQQLI